MAGEKHTSWFLNLDIKDAIDKLDSFKSSLGDAASTESLSELISKFGELGIALGVIGGAVLGVKEAFDLTLEAEQIRAIGQEFDTMATSAGLYGADLKDALEKSSGGLIDETKLLKLASQAIVGLGSSAKQLPDIMTVARQVTTVFGGEIADNFHNIVQAIESGQTRMLKNYGIVVDQQKAYKDYAASLGIAASELSQSGKQQAMVNAVLAQSKTAFAGVDVNILQTTNNWEEFKATMKDVADVVTLLFDKIFGPAVRDAIVALRDVAHVFKDEVTAAFGEGREKIEAHLSKVKGDIEGIQTILKNKEAFGMPLNEGQIKTYEAELKKLQGEYDNAEAALKKYSDTDRASHAQAIKNSQALSAQASIDLKKREDDLLKFQQQVNKLREQNLTDEIKDAQSSAEVAKLHDEEIKLSKQQLAAEIKRINQLEGLDVKQKDLLIEQTQLQHNLKMKAFADKLAADNNAAWDNYAQHATSRIDGVARAFAAASQKNKQNLKDFSQLGKASFDSFSKNAVSAFEAIGSGSETVQQALLQMFLSPLSDIAIQQGTFMMLSGIWPPNPVALAGGAALIALGGVLKGIAGGGGGGAPATPPSAGANSAVTGYGTTAETPAVGSVQSPTNLQQVPQRTTNLVVQGNYYDTNEAKTALMDMIRSATDSTDFNYFKVGGQ